MTNIDLARLSCRFLSLYAVVLIVPRLFMTVSSIIGLCKSLIDPGQEFDSSNFLQVLFSIIIPFILLVILCILLWKCADWLAARMVKDEKSMSTSIDADTLQAIIVVGFGIYFLVNGLIHLWGFIYQFMGNNYLMAYPYNWSSIVSIVLGTVLILGSGTISAFITKLRTAGQNSA